MSKKIRYREPEMPDSLKRLLELDIEDARYVSGRKPSLKAKSSKRSLETKQSKNIRKKQPNKSVQKRPTEQHANTNSKQAYSTRKNSNNRNDKREAVNGDLRQRKYVVDNNAAVLDKRPKKPIREPEKPIRNNKLATDRSVKKKQPSHIGKETYRTEKKSSVKAKVKVNNSVREKNKINKNNSKKKKGVGNIFVYILNIFRMLIDFILNGGDRKLYIDSDRKRKFDKKFLRTNSIILVGIMLILLLVNIVTPTQKISEAENRTLAQKPKFTVSRFMNGKFGEDYSTYISDQFVLRKSFIKTKANFDRFMGKKEINGVYICKDGYLMEGFKRSADDVTKTKLASINKFANDNKNIKLSVLLSPNKVEVYNNLMPANAPVDSQKEYMKYVESGLDKRVKFVNILDALNRAKNNEQLYFKTDHHWTVDGAYIAYTNYCKALNIEPVGLNSFTKSLATDKFYGSLYYKNAAQIGKPDKLEMYLQQNDLVVLSKYYDTKKKVPSLYDVSKLDTKDPYQVFTGGNHTQIKIRTNVETDRKLLIFKDSYANAMLPFLVNNYSEIMVVDLRYYAGSVKDLVNNGSYTDALILANINTFNTDSSILNLNY